MTPNTEKKLNDLLQASALGAFYDAETNAATKRALALLETEMSREEAEVTLARVRKQRHDAYQGWLKTQIKN